MTENKSAKESHYNRRGHRRLLKGAERELRSHISRLTAKGSSQQGKTYCETAATQYFCTAKLWYRNCAWRKYLGIDTRDVHWTSAYKSVNNMLGYLERQKSNSLSSKAVHCEAVYLLCMRNHTNPNELIKQKKSCIEQIIQSFADDIFDRTNSPRYSNTKLYQLKLFFRVNGFVNSREPCVKKYFVEPRSRKQSEYIPTPKEVLEMANDAGSLRNRVLILLLAFTGLRVSTALALRIIDLREELEHGFKNIILHVSKELKKINPNAAKNKIPYYVFSIKFLTDELSLYLSDLSYELGSLDDDDALFPTSWERLDLEQRRKTSVGKDRAERIIKQAARKAGIPRWQDIHPHCLRKTYKSHFLAKQPLGLLTEDDMKFFMGWLLPGAQDTYFDKDKIEEMRQKWSRFIIPGIDDEKPSSTVQEIAEIFDIDYQQLKGSLKYEFGREPTTDEERVFLKKKLKDIIRAQTEGQMPRIKQIIVHKDELESWLEKGALYKDTVDDKVIIELSETLYEKSVQLSKTAVE